MNRQEWLRMGAMGLILAVIVYAVGRPLFEGLSEPPAEEIADEDRPRISMRPDIAQLEQERDRLLREAKQKPPQTPDPGPKDGPPAALPPEPFQERPEIFEPVKDETEGYEGEVFEYLMTLLKRLSPDQIRARAEPLEHRQGSPNRLELFKEPARHRGRFIRITGTIFFYETRLREVGPLSPSGVQRLFFAVLKDQRRYPYHCLLIDKDRDYRYGRDVVEFSGVFLKKYLIETADGEKRVFPLLVGRVLRPHQNPTLQDLYPYGFAWATSAVVILGGLALIFVVWHWRRDDRSFDAAQIRRRLRRVDPDALRALRARGRPQGDAPGEPPATPSPPPPPA